MMIDLIVLVSLLGLGYFFGSRAEKRHFESIIKREVELSKLPLIPAKTLPIEFQSERFENKLVDGSVVISVDYFKRFLSGLRALVGGRVRAYETLVERARREALLRMKQQAADCGSIMIFNCKLETASISKGQGNAIGSVEVYAYGTALIPKPKS